MDVKVHSRKSLLYLSKDPLITKLDEEFHVTVGSFDGAEVCKMIELFVLDKLSSEFDLRSMGVYRDESLSIFHNKNDHQNDQIRGKKYIYLENIS